MLIEHDGRKLTATAWAEKTGLKRTTILGRLRKGWSVRRALETSLHPDWKHGAAKKGQWTPEYCAWRGMKARCYIPIATAFHKYGARGIRVADEWRDDFAAFFAYVGLKPSPRHSIERIDNDGNYEPGNVRWATPVEQARNRRSSRLLEYRGKKRTLAEWAELTGMSPHNIKMRIDKLGWTVDEAISTPRGRAYTRTMTKARMAAKLTGQESFPACVVDLDAERGGA